MKPATFEDWVSRLAPLQVIAPAERFFHGQDPRVVAERLTLFYESGRNLRKHLKQYAGFEPNARQASDIAACLRQGREFLRSSQNADLIIKPITLYYGMACYAKALTISFGNPGALDQFPSRHGLKAPSIFGVPMEDLWLRADGNDGLFQRFVSVLGEVSGILAETRDGHKLWIHVDTGAAGIGSFETNLKGLLARVVGLEDFFRATFDELPQNAPVELKLAQFGPPDALPQASLVFKLPPGSNEAWVRSLHPRLENWLYRDKENKFGDQARGEAIFENLAPETDPRPPTADEQARLLRPLGDLLIPMTRGSQGDYRLVGAVGGITVPEPAIQLATAFLLSTVARYRPDIWSVFSSFNPGDKDLGLRALLEAFFERALTIYPLQILAALGRTGIVVWSGRPLVWA